MAPGIGIGFRRRRAGEVRRRKGGLSNLLRHLAQEEEDVLPVHRHKRVGHEPSLEPAEVLEVVPRSGGAGAAWVQTRAAWVQTREGAAFIR